MCTTLQNADHLLGACASEADERSLPLACAARAPVSMYTVHSADTIPRDESQVAAVLHEHLPCGLCWIDAHTVCAFDSRHRERLVIRAWECDSKLVPFVMMAVVSSFSLNCNCEQTGREQITLDGSSGGAVAPLQQQT